MEMVAHDAKVLDSEIVLLFGPGNRFQEQVLHVEPSLDVDLGIVFFNLSHIDLR
jgi:hypothetical protein